MERICTVARDGGTWPVRRLAAIMALCTLAALLPGESNADPTRPRTGARQPQRPARQSAQEVDPEFEERESRAEGNQTASISGAEAGDPADELPEHVHPKHPLVPALRMAYSSRATLRNVRDYSAQFVKKELLGNGYIIHNMDMKFREEPFSVYLKFRDPHAGRQVLYVAGANEGKLLVREVGIKSLAGTVQLLPNDRMAMSENRHPITEIGISNMLEVVIRQWEAEARYGETDVKYFPKAKLGDFPVRVIRTVHPTRRRQFKFHMTQLYLDDQTLFPVRVEQFDWPQREGENPVQVELYMYSDVRTNQGFTNADFDPRRYKLR